MCHVVEHVDGSAAYAIDSIIKDQPKTGVMVLIAFPITPVLHAGESHDECSYMACGEASPVVIKAVPLHPINKRSSPTSFRAHHAVAGDEPLSEIGALQILQQYRPHHHHSHHVNYLMDCMQDRHYIYMVFPFLSGGDLFSRVKAARVRGLSDSQASWYLRQMAEGLLYMKEVAGMAHHDVSLENAMVSDDNVVKIIDFGMCIGVPFKAAPTATAAANGSSSGPIYLTPQRCRGKPSYVAPEVVREEACDPFASDIWSLGVSLYSMLTARPLYSSPKDTSFNMLAQGQVEKVVDTYESYGLPQLSPDARHLVCAMLQADPAKRPTLEEVLLHPFLNQPRVPVVPDSPITTSITSTAATSSSPILHRISDVPSPRSEVMGWM